jgi:hypothetical protein
VKAEWVDQDGLRHQFCIIKFLNLSESNFSGGEGSGFRVQERSSLHDYRGRMPLPQEKNSTSLEAVKENRLPWMPHENLD